MGDLFLGIRPPEVAEKDEIGKGTYGVVYRYGSKQVIKKFKSFGSCFEQSILRELIFYSYFHTNKTPFVPRPAWISYHDTHWYMVMNHCGKPLHKEQWSFQTKVKISHQLILSLIALQKTRGFLHRDLKPENILWDATTERLSIIDWGLAFGSIFRPNTIYSRTGKGGRRGRSHHQLFTPDVQTLWYRAPEVLLWDRPSGRYGETVDVWSIGVILLELWTGIGFHGDCEVDQLFKYFQSFGTPSRESAPELYQRAAFLKSFPKWRPRLRHRLSEEDRRNFARIHPDFEELLLDGLLCLSPARRFTVTQIAEFSFVKEWAKALPATLPPPPVYPPGIFRQSVVTPSMLGVLFDWMAEVTQSFQLNFSTMFMAQSLVNRFLGKTQVARQSLQLVSLAALSLASLFLEIHPVESLSTWVGITDGAYSKKDLIHMQMELFTHCSDFISLYRSNTWFLLVETYGPNPSPELWLGLNLLLQDSIYNPSHFSAKPTHLCRGIIQTVFRIFDSNPEETLKPKEPWYPFGKPKDKKLKMCQDLFWDETLAKSFGVGPKERDKIETSGIFSHWEAMIEDKAMLDEETICQINPLANKEQK